MVFIPYTHIKIIGIILIFLPLLISGCITSNPSDNNTTKNQQPEQTGENFSFTLLDGTKTNLSSFYGTPILVDMMAVNCQPCIYEMFVLYDLSQNYSKDELTIISIDVWISLGETIDLVHQLIDAFDEQQDMDLDWTFAVDDSRGTIAQHYANKGVPTIYILDENGNIYYTNFGYESYSTLSSKIDELLE